MSTNKKKSHSNRSQFIRSLAVCSAVLGLGAGYVANPIQAKSSPVKVRTNRQMKKVVTVRTTGKNAIYNKAGVLNSAKVVVNKKRTGAMGKSKRSGHYFRAYRVAKLSNGAVYYKVVSFDGKYRGWVYGGRSINKINGGLKSVNTTKAVKTPNKNNIYQFKAGQSVWKHPERSVYKNGKVLGSTTNYTKHELKVTKAVRLTREGTLYYYVKNQTQPKLSGWVKASGLKLVSRGSAEADKAPDVIETLPNLPGTGSNDSSGGNNSNGNENSGGSGEIITEVPELPGIPEPIMPEEPNEPGNGSEETPDPDDNNNGNETGGAGNSGEETPDPGDNSGESETDGSEDGTEETPDPGDNSGESETDGSEDGTEEAPDPGDNSGESETDGPEDGSEETPDPGDGSGVIEMTTLNWDLMYTLNRDSEDDVTQYQVYGLFSLKLDDGGWWCIPYGSLLDLAGQAFPGIDSSDFRIYDSNGSVVRYVSDIEKNENLNLEIDKNNEYSVSEIRQMLNEQNADHFMLDFYIAPVSEANGKKLHIQLEDVEYVFKDKDGNLIGDDDKTSYDDMLEISMEATRHLKSEVIDDDNSGNGNKEPSDGSGETETGGDNFIETDDENIVIVNVNRTFNIDANDLEDIQSLRALADYFNQFMYINTGESLLLPKGKLLQKVQEMLPNEDPNSFRVFDQYGNIADRIEMIDSLSPMEIELDKDKEYSYQDVKDLMWDEANKQDYPQFYIGSVNDSNKNAVKFSFSSYLALFLDKDGKSLDPSDSFSGAEWASVKLIYIVAGSGSLTVLPK